MKTAGKVISGLIILAVAGVVFYLGWVQFKVSPENCGVLVSKTSGVCKTPVMPGKFTWRWEPLLPTNTQLRIFSLSPYVTVKSENGTLPSADIYSQFIRQTPDFSYSFKFNISLKFTPEGIVSQVKKNNAKDDSDLNGELDRIASLAAKRAAAWFIAKASGDPSFRPELAGTEDLLKAVNAAVDFSDESFVSFSISSCTVPDMELYNQAKVSFDKYRKNVDTSLAVQSVKDAAAISEDSREMIRLEKLGEVLRKYPELSDLLKSGDVGETLKAIKSLQ